MAWIESHQTLAKHPKLLRLARELGISRVQAVGHLHFLWWWAADYAQEGVVSCFDAEEIAEAAEWEGDANRFVSALLNGWIDEKDGKLVLHDWHDYFGKLLARRARHASYMRTTRERDSHVKVTCEATQPNPTIPNQEHSARTTLPKGAFEDLWRLIAADVIGVTIYRKHADWPKLWRLFPWVAGGVVLGCFALGRVSNAQVGRLIGGILLAMVALHLWRQRPLARDANGFGAQLPHTWWFAGVIGAWAGFTTMVADAAGPVMVMFLLAAGLPKQEFLGTMAWFFLVVNCFKVPFSAWLGLINVGSLNLDAWLLIAMVPGALLGPVNVKRINQQTFEQMPVL